MFINLWALYQNISLNKRAWSQFCKYAQFGCIFGKEGHKDFLEKERHIQTQHSQSEYFCIMHPVKQHAIWECMTHLLKQRTITGNMGKDLNKAESPQTTEIWIPEDFSPHLMPTLVFFEASTAAAREQNYSKKGNDRGKSSKNGEGVGV